MKFRTNYRQVQLEENIGRKDIVPRCPQVIHLCPCVDLSKIIFLKFLNSFFSIFYFSKTFKKFSRFLKYAWKKLSFFKNYQSLFFMKNVHFESLDKELDEIVGEDGHVLLGEFFDDWVNQVHDRQLVLPHFPQLILNQSHNLRKLVKFRNIAIFRKIVRKLTTLK